MWSSEIRIRQLYDVMYRGDDEDDGSDDEWEATDDGGFAQIEKECIVVLPRKSIKSLALIREDREELFPLEYWEEKLREDYKLDYIKGLETIEGGPYREEPGKVLLHLRFIKIEKSAAANIFFSIVNRAYKDSSIGTTIHLVVGNDKNKNSSEIVYKPKSEVSEYINQKAAVNIPYFIPGGKAKVSSVVHIDDLDPDN